MNLLLRGSTSSSSPRTWGSTVVCGDRMDTYALKKHLKEIGFDYDAECDAIRAEMEQK